MTADKIRPHDAVDYGSIARNDDDDDDGRGPLSDDDRAVLPPPAKDGPERMGEGGWDAVPLASGRPRGGFGCGVARARPVVVVLASLLLIALAGGLCGAALLVRGGRDGASASVGGDDDDDGILRVRLFGSAADGDDESDGDGAPAAIMPFETIARSDYGTPASDIVDPELFHPSLLGGRLLRVPFPTGAFWTNLVLTETAAEGGISYPVMAYPYAYRWNPHHVQVSYPPLRRIMDSISIRDIFNPDLTFGSVETSGGEDGGVKREVTAFDPLSVSLRYHRTTAAEEGKGGGHHASSTWETSLVQGSPYVTVRYDDATPTVRALSIFRRLECPPNASDEGECASVKDASIQTTTRPPMVRRGTRFVFVTNENISWLVFASHPVTLSLDAVRRTTVTSTEKYTGVLRFAILPPLQDEPIEYTSQFPARYEDAVDLGGEAKSSAVKRLGCHANVYPIGGGVEWDFPRGDDEKENAEAAVVRFRYETRTMDNDGNAAGGGGDEEDVGSTARRTKGGSNGKSKDEKCGDGLLVLGLPHHAEVLPQSALLSSPDDFDLTYRSIKGHMVPFVVNGSGDGGNGAFEWSYHEKLTTLGFDSDESLRNAAAMDSSTKKRILVQVEKDMKRVLPTRDENVYGFGKQVARLAQLAHIASVLEGGSTHGEGSSGGVGDESLLSGRIARVLHGYLADYLSGKNRDVLLYDADFGGIVSKDGLQNSAGDFGNGWYNDHLFHYGYILYAAAVLGRLDSAFVAEHGPAVDALLADVAYNTNADSRQQRRSASDDPTGSYFLPLARHKSWFDSHSFASGLFPFADGKSMESSGEAVNCYYGAYLWSSVRWGDGADDNDSRTAADRDKVNFARLLLATEIRGVKTYWHMVTPDMITPDEDGTDAYHSAGIYSPTFAKNLMVGNVGMMDVTVSTWFGTENLYVHMINFMPVTAVTRELFERRYMEEEFDRIIEPMYDGVEMAWKGYVVCDRAMSDSATAWEDAMQLRSFELDSAISQSQVLYFIATMDGFAAPPPAGAGSDHDGGGGDDREGGASGLPSELLPASCAEHSACAALGLTGLCCPTPNGVVLGCCNSEGKEVEAVDVPQVMRISEDSKSCAANSACAALGLAGACCPALSGAYLGCCD